MGGTAPVNEKLSWNRVRGADLVVEIISDCLIPACNDFVCLCEEPLLQVDVAAAVFARVLGDVHAMWKLVGLKLPICQGEQATSHTYSHSTSSQYKGTDLQISFLFSCLA